MPIAHTTHSNQTPHHPITPSLKKVVPAGGQWLIIYSPLFTNSVASHCPPYDSPHYPISPSLKKVVPGWWAVADDIFTALANSVASHCPPYDYPYLPISLSPYLPISLSPHLPISPLPTPHVTKRKKKPIDTGTANSIS
ncbi:MULTISPECIES: hypothetical protein [unclassified Moorena]|nr:MULTISPECIES: hypothetical protein [unclassified Moorena]